MLLCYCVFVRHKKVSGMKLFCLLFFLLLQGGSVVFIPIMQLMFVLLFINFLFRSAGLVINGAFFVFCYYRD